MSQLAFRELEPYAVKVARTVLRGPGGSNATWVTRLGCFACGSFCSSLESIRFRRQPEGLYNGLQMALAKQNNRGDGVGE